MAKHMVLTYLHFRILKFPLNYGRSANLKVFDQLVQVLTQLLDQRSLELPKVACSFSRTSLRPGHSGLGGFYHEE